MRNIMSYPVGSQFSGKEILDWATYHVTNETSHKKEAGWILKHFHNLNPSATYERIPTIPSPAGIISKYHPFFKRVDKCALENFSNSHNM